MRPLTLMLCALAVFTTSRVSAAPLHRTFSLGTYIDAKYPYPHVPNTIYAATVKSHLQRPLPIHRCVLFHGFGLTQGLIDLMVRGQGLGASLLKLAILTSGRSPVQAMTEAYFGGAAVMDDLRTHICDEVIATVQESTQSTTWEMTQRSEAFLAQPDVCGMDRSRLAAGQKACAVIGHSKGGAMVSLLMLRCKDQSAPNENVCRNLDEVYTSSAAHGGISISALIAGLSATHQEQKAEQYFADLFNSSRVAPKWHRDLSEPNLALGIYFDLFSDVLLEQTNPVWFDMSPLVPVDGGLTMGERFATADATHSGWFRGDYAANGSMFDFRLEGMPAPGTPLKPDVTAWRELETVGKQSQLPIGRLMGDLASAVRQGKEGPSFIDEQMQAMSDKFSRASLMLHDPELKPAFEAGVKLLQQTAENRGISRDVLLHTTWKSYQYGDGVVDVFAALALCYRTYTVPEQRVHKCKAFGRSGGEAALNHFAVAGYDHQASAHLFEALLD